MALGTLRRLRSLDRRLWVLTAGWFINALGFSMVFPFLTVYLKNERGFPIESIGVVFLVMGFARIVGVLLAGVVVDRIGRRKVMIGAPALRGVVFLLLALTIHWKGSLWEIARLLALASFVGSFFQTAADTYVADLVEPERRSDAYAVLRVGLNVGWMTGPAIGAFLARTPYSLLFTVTAATTFALGTIAWIFCHETLGISRSAGLSGGSRTSLAIYLRHPHFLFFCGMTLLLFLGSSQLVSTLAAYTTGPIIGASQKQLGLLYTFNGLLVAVFQIPVNGMMRRLPLRTRMAAGALVYAMGYGLLGAARSYPHILGCIALVSVAEMLVMPASISIATRFAPDEAKGRFVGLFSMMRGLGFSVGPFIGCALYAHFAGREYMVWAVLPWITIAGAVGLLAMRHPAAAAVEGAGAADGEEGGEREKS